MRAGGGTRFGGGGLHSLHHVLSLGRLGGVFVEVRGQGSDRRGGSTDARRDARRMRLPTLVAVTLGATGLAAAERLALEALVELLDLGRVLLRMRLEGLTEGGAG